MQQQEEEYPQCKINDFETELRDMYRGIKINSKRVG
jgi:hypothetical protein